MTAKAVNPRAVAMRQSIWPINTSLRFGWADLFQIDIELVGAITSDQRQFERCAVGIGSRRHSIQLESKAFDARRSVLEKFWHRQRPVRCWTLDKQIDRFLIGRDHIDHNGGLALALDVADRERVRVADR